MSDIITGMSIDTWESHLESRGNPMLEGMWGDTPWGFYEYNQEVPDTLSVRTGMCVPVCSLDTRYPQVMLTLNRKRDGFEIPGGHRELLSDGKIESAPQAAARETPEETGLYVAPELLLPYGYTEARNTSADNYPPLSYMQFFSAYTPNHPDIITDPEVDGAGIFTIDALRRMTERGEIKSTEFALIRLGVRAVFRHQGLSDEHVTLS